MKRIVIHQPNLFPRLKVLQKIASAHVWVIFDDVQYVKREWQNRTKLRHLKQPMREFWLTAPVNCPDGRRTLIKDVTLVHPEQFYGHLLKTIQFTYGQSRYWDWIEAYINTCILNRPSSLTELCVETVLVCFQKLDINIETHYSSSLAINGKATQKLTGICEALDADIYVSGSGSRAYMQLDIMQSANIDVVWQNWQEPVVKLDKNVTLQWRNFSFIDFLARFGPAKTRAHLLLMLRDDELSP